MRIEGRAGAAWLLLLGGCDGCRPDEELPTVLVPVESSASRVWVGDAIGAPPLSVPVVAVNLAGGIVPGATLTVDADGATVVEGPSPDGSGWASVLVDGPEGEASVHVSSGGSSAEGVAAFVAADPPAWGDPAVQTGVPGAAAIAGAGFAWAEQGRVYWASPSGGAPVRVLDLSYPVRGMRSLQLDNDGVADLLAWSDLEVVVLRGRSGGGVTWSAGWVAAEGTVIGVDAQDLDGNASLDLAVAVAVDTSTTRVAHIVSVGGGWEYVDVLEVPWVAWGVSGEDLDGDGDAEITLLAEGGLLKRFGHFEGDWVALADAEYDLGLASGASLLSSVDLDGDGSEDLVALGPDAGGNGWQAYVVSPAAHTVYRMFAGAKIEAPPTALWGDEADLDGDGLRDLVLATDDDLRRGRWVAEQSNFAIDRLALPAGGPVGAGDADGDGVDDVVVAGAPVKLHRGELGGSGWRGRDAGEEWMAAHVVGRPTVRDLDGDGLVDLASFQESEGVLRVQVYLGTGEEALADALDFLDAVALPDATEALGLAACGRDLYALVRADDHRLLFRVPVDASLGLGDPEWGVEVAGDALTCVSGVAVVGGEDASVTAYVEDGGALPVALPDADGPVYGIAAFDPDGDGVIDEVATCGEPGCEVIAADVDGDGSREAVEWRADGLYVDLERREVAAPVGVSIAAGDADGDGVDDVLAQAGGAVWVFRADAGWVSPPVVRHVGFAVQGPAFVLPGPGRPSLLFVSADADPSDEVDDGGMLVRVPAP